MPRRSLTTSEKDKAASLLVEGNWASGALLDGSGCFRYHLWRRWQADATRLCFIMLNPSTADHVNNDPTITRCLGFARDWRCGSLDVVNLFAWRATDSASLARIRDPVGPENDRVIAEVAARADAIVVAWGNRGVLWQRQRSVLELLAKAKKLQCLGVTAAGHPRHPLYLPSATALCPFIAPPI